MQILSLPYLDKVFLYPDQKAVVKGWQNVTPPSLALLLPKQKCRRC